MRLVCCFAILAFSAMSACIVSRAASSETTGRVVLCNQTGLLVSHLLCCLHIIPLEYIPQVVSHHVARVSAQCVLHLQKLIFSLNKSQTLRRISLSMKFPEFFLALQGIVPNFVETKKAQVVAFT